MGIIAAIQGGDMDESDSDQVPELVAEVDWLPPKRALELLASANGGSFLFRRSVAELLRDGKIRARAKRSSRVTATSIHEAWTIDRKAVPASVLKHVDHWEAIKPSVWQGSHNWGDDVENWRWISNGMAITVKCEPPTFRILRSVELNAADLSRQFRAKAAGARGVSAETWRGFAWALCQVMLESRDNATPIGGRGELADLIRKKAQENFRGGVPKVATVGKTYAHREVKLLLDAFPDLDTNDRSAKTHKAIPGSEMAS